MNSAVREKNVKVCYLGEVINNTEEVDFNISLWYNCNYLKNVAQKKYTTQTTDILHCILMHYYFQ